MHSCEPLWKQVASGSSRLRKTRDLCRAELLTQVAVTEWAVWHTHTHTHTMEAPRIYLCRKAFFSDSLQGPELRGITSQKSFKILTPPVCRLTLISAQPWPGSTTSPSVTGGTHVISQFPRLVQEAWTSCCELLVPATPRRVSHGVRIPWEKNKGQCYALKQRILQASLMAL